MEEASDPADNLPARVSAESKADSATLLRLQEALRLRSPGAVAEQARQAGLEKNKDCLTLLCRIVQTGNRLLWRREEWKKARSAAIEALAQLQDASVLPVLLRAVQDRDETIREAASSALLSFGEKAVSPLMQTLTQGGDWKTGGMKAVLALLGKLENRKAAPTLARVLFGEYPPSPPRWMRQTVLYPVLLTLFLALVIWVTSGMAFGQINILALIGITAGCLLLLLLAEMFLIVPFTSLQHGQERQKLATEAAYALNRIRDKLALPSLISAAYGYHRLPRPVAREVLFTLLPLLDTEDEGLLRQDTLNLLLAEMGRADPSHALTVLRSLEFIGMGSAVPAVKRLVERGATPEIKSEALRILPILEERQRLEQASSHLLRASALPQDAPETLLRAASYQEETAPQQLLRPGQNPDAE